MSLAGPVAGVARAETHVLPRKAMAWVLQVEGLFINRMRIKILLISSVFIFQVTGAQTAPSPGTSTQSPGTAPAQGTVTTPPAAASSTPVTPPVSPGQPAAPDPLGEQTKIVDYKSIYEAATLEEEVKMATERFSLTPSQQDIWLSAARDRRQTEKQTQDLLGDSTKTGQYDRSGVYMGLRNSHNTFHETIMGYLTPTQKQAFETDRLILNEKQKRLAKLPPPPPPAPAVTVTVVDSAAIKDSEAPKAKGKKSKKKKKSSGK